MAKGVTIDLIVDPARAIQGIGEVEREASGASSFFGDLGKVAGGALLALSAAAVAGAVSIGAATVRAFGEYEQLAGGVTKLFGDADVVVSQFAANAANSAGLSTNAYLNTVTSFSASLISGLGGDQAKAAQIADMAITDMADNANTFGTSMESLQQTYQGFAKGQFAMLDNLKLGYGGTAGEMARLINESGVLNGAFEVTAETVTDVPFATMVEAINQVQIGLGIAGTTAKEAATTIRGSLGATKASFDNLLLGFGQADADFDILVGNLATNAQNLVNNVIPVIGRLGEALPQVVPVLLDAVEQALPALLPAAADVITSLVAGVVKAAPKLIEGAVPIIMSLVSGLVSMLPAVLDAALKIIVALARGIASALPQLIPAAVAAVVGLVGALIDNLPLLLEAGLQLILGLVTGLVTALPQLIAALPGIIIGIVEFLVNAIPTIIDAGINLFLALIGALPDIIIGIVTAIPQIIIGIQVALINALPLIIEAGIKLFLALITAMPTIVQEIAMATPQIVTGIVGAISASMPQLVSAGRDLIMGLWNGMVGMRDWLWGRVSGFFNDMLSNVMGLLGIHSPSTVFAGFGDNLVLGLEKGLTGPNNLKSIMSDLSQQVTSGFSGGLNVRAQALVKSSYLDDTGNSLGASAASTQEFNMPIYMLPEQDPRIVGRQFGREFARTMAGVP